MSETGASGAVNRLPDQVTPELSEEETWRRWQEWRDTPAYQRLATMLEKMELLPSENIREAFHKVDRGDFLPGEWSMYGVVDRPVPIGYGQSSSQPTLVAFMLSRLGPEPGQQILDVGVGSGWTVALLAYAVGETGQVFGTERVPELVEFAQNRLNRYPIQNADVRLASEKLGLAEAEPYDRILVSAESTDEQLDQLKQQLNVGGVMIIPLKDHLKEVVRRSETDFDISILVEGTSFVPLIDGPAAPGELDKSALPVEPKPTDSEAPSQP